MCTSRSRMTDMDAQTETGRDVGDAEVVADPPRLTLLLFVFLVFLVFLVFFTFFPLDDVFFGCLPLFLYVDLFTVCFFLYVFLGYARNKRI